MTEEELQNYRRARLVRFVDELSGGPSAVMSKFNLPRSWGSQYAQIKGGSSFASRAARNMEVKLHLSSMYLDQMDNDVASNVREIESRAKVPVISWIQAGELSEVFDIFHPGEAVQWEDAIYSKPSKHSYALVVEGDSMDRPGATPNFPAGTILIVDPDRASHAGDYVIAKDVATQKATFKQLTTDGSRWYLKAINPAYQAIEIDDPALRVIGRVIEFRPPGGKL